MLQHHLPLYALHENVWLCANDDAAPHVEAGMRQTSYDA
jgi:hypothetical protein